jgi:hypothetical protein
MPSCSKLTCLNIVLISTFVALVLGCGGDPEDPPPGSLQEKLCGKWVSDPIPFVEGDGFTTIEIEMSYWNCGLIANCPDMRSLHSRESMDSHKSRCSVSGFKFDGMTATSDGGTFRVDAEQPDVMYASLMLNNDTKLLNEVKFKKKK